MKLSFCATCFAMATMPLISTSQSIAEVASGQPTLSTLVALVGAADLLGAIDGSAEGNITVFAPTNDAFGELAPTFVANLQTAAWEAHLSSILTSHIVDSVIPSSAITDPTTVTTLSGEIVSVTVDPIAIDGAEVSTPDIQADNGIVHVIDGVITPGWVDTTIPVAASSVPAASTLVSLLEQADLVDTLAGEGPFTVFAPTNEAFTALGPDITACVTENPEILSQTLLYHVVGALVPASLVTTGMVTTAQGSDIDIDVSTLMINGASEITGPNRLLANNGIAHVIDTVLVPPTLAANITACVNSKKTIPQLASGVESVSTLVALLSDANLVDTLNGEGPFTVFAPTNEAFAALGEPTTTCVTGNDDWLSATLLYHVLAANVPAADVATGEVATVEGSTISIDADALTVNSANIVAADALVGVNGVAHVIDAVLVPPTILDDVTACVDAAAVTAPVPAPKATPTGAPTESSAPMTLSVAFSLFSLVVGFLMN